MTGRDHPAAMPENASKVSLIKKVQKNLPALKDASKEAKSAAEKSADEPYRVDLVKKKKTEEEEYKVDLTKKTAEKPADKPPTAAEQSVPPADKPAEPAAADAKPEQSPQPQVADPVKPEERPQPGSEEAVVPEGAAPTREPGRSGESGEETGEPGEELQPRRRYPDPVPERDTDREARSAQPAQHPGEAPAQPAPAPPEQPQPSQAPGTPGATGTPAAVSGDVVEGTGTSAAERPVTQHSADSPGEVHDAPTEQQEVRPRPAHEAQESAVDDPRTTVAPSAGRAVVTGEVLYRGADGRSWRAVEYAPPTSAGAATVTDGGSEYGSEIPLQPRTRAPIMADEVLGDASDVAATPAPSPEGQYAAPSVPSTTGFQAPVESTAPHTAAPAAATANTQASTGNANTAAANTAATTQATANAANTAGAQAAAANRQAASANTNTAAANTNTSGNTGQQRPNQSSGQQQGQQNQQARGQEQQQRPQSNRPTRGRLRPSNSPHIPNPDETARGQQGWTHGQATPYEPMRNRVVRQMRNLRVMRARAMMAGARLRSRFIRRTTRRRPQ